MYYKRGLFIIVFGCMFLLNACGTSKVTYKEGFPSEKSPALSEFVRSLTAGENYHLKQDDRHIFAKNLGKDDKKSNYYQYTNQQLEQYYQDFLQKEMTSKQFDNLRFDAKRELFQPVDHPEKNKLPQIEMKDENVLRITTTEAEKNVNLTDLLKDYHVEKSDEVYFDVLAVTDKEFQLRIYDKDLGDSVEQEMMVFIKQDLSDSVVMEDSSEELDKEMQNGHLDDYQELFISVADKIDLIKSSYGHWIWDRQEQTIKDVAAQDNVSEDGAYVYLGGKDREISDGVQRIQRIDDYIAGNDNYETEFKLRYKKIAKELGFKTSGVSIATVMYFNQDYVVLALNYKGRIVGDAGFTNVIVDLQNKDKPTAYLVDLDWL